LISGEDAALVLSKWRAERTPLRIVARLSCGTFAFDCFILGFSEKSIGFQLEREMDICEIFVSGFSFEFKDPRSPEEAAAIAGGHTYSQCLCATSASGESIFIMEISS
jgi:hypothetical protein